MREDQLAHYRERLVKLQSRLMSEAREAVDRITDEAAPPAELSHLPTHAADHDTEGFDRYVAVEASCEQILEAIEAALARMDEGTYGNCADCGADISASRLDALPFALRCVGCEQKWEQERE